MNNFLKACLHKFQLKNYKSVYSYFNNRFEYLLSFIKIKKLNLRVSNLTSGL